jgi:Bifunctional DNA primase/polymerase, N-terminal
MIALREAYLAQYAGLSLSAVPLRPREKRPLKRGWQVPNALDWLNVPMDANVGIRTGEVSGHLTVLDFDREDLLRKWLLLSPRELAAHTIVTVTRRGFHVYARHVGIQTRTVEEGFTILGTGSLVVAPPSIHATGFQYHHLSPPRRIADLSSLADVDALLNTPNTTTSNKRAGAGGAAAGPAAEPAAGAASGAAEPEPAEALDPELVVEAEERILRQAPKLREKYAILKAGGPTPPGFDRSGADFAIARCLWEAGWSSVDAARFLRRLPGSKARERGWGYALFTARRAGRRP